MQGRRREAKLRLTAVIATLFVVVAGLYWWLRFLSDGSAYNRSAEGGPKNTAGPGNWRLGFAQPANKSDTGELDKGCGVSRITVLAPQFHAADNATLQRLKSLRRRWQTALLANADNRARAVGLILQSTDDAANSPLAQSEARDALA